MWTTSASRSPTVPGADAAITASSLSERDGLTLTLLAPNLGPAGRQQRRPHFVGGPGAGEYLLEVRSNRVPTRYTLVFDLDDGAEPGYARPGRPQRLRAARRAAGR